MDKKFLDTAYSARDSDETRGLYDDWSGSYDAEMAANAYKTPGRCADALAANTSDKSVPLLDFGCGTGLAGKAFHEAGFTILDGVDLSSDMIEQARSKNIYRTLTRIEPDAPVPGGYALIAAVGVIGAGAAPLSTLDLLLNALPSGGLLVFSFNDLTLADPQSTGRLNEWLDCGAARLLVAENGPHLPEKDMQSTVYVVEKA